MENELLVTILSSTAIATVLSNIIQVFINKSNNKIERDRIREEREYETAQLNRKKKEAAYIKALSHSLSVKNILEAHRDKEKYSKEDLNRMIREMNDLLQEVAPELRLYSTKLVFESFRRLSRSVRIINTGKEITENYLVAINSEYDFLVKLMKEDLGYKDI